MFDLVGYLCLKPNWVHQTIHTKMITNMMYFKLSRDQVDCISVISMKVWLKTNDKKIIILIFQTRICKKENIVPSKESFVNEQI